eukprot:scaffold854_cov95-Skeletonema_dohrnii-CCMP3373.AAC.7
MSRKITDSVTRKSREPPSWAEKSGHVDSERAISANKRCERLIRERHVIEEKISTTRHEQTSISKAARNPINEEKSLLAKIHDKELEIATILNVILQARYDKLNTQSHNYNSVRQKILEDELSALHSAEAKITVHEGEMKRCNNEIVKNTNHVALLNREYSRVSLVSILYMCITPHSTFAA